MNSDLPHSITPQVACRRRLHVDVHWRFSLEWFRWSTLWTTKHPAWSCWWMSVEICPGLRQALSVSASVCLFVSLYVAMSVCLSLCMSPCLSVCLSVCLSCLSVCLSKICLSPVATRSLRCSWCKTLLLTRQKFSQTFWGFTVQADGAKGVVWVLCVRRQRICVGAECCQEYIRTFLYLMYSWCCAKRWQGKALTKTHGVKTGGTYIIQVTMSVIRGLMNQNGDTIIVIELRLHVLQRLQEAAEAEVIQSLSVCLSVCLYRD